MRLPAILILYLCSLIFNWNMIHQKLFNPTSIAVIGGSNNVHKPGGKLVKNLLDGNFKGSVYIVILKKI
jgi:acyl-CoA synthetase (NDP forming)